MNLSLGTGDEQTGRPLLGGAGTNADDGSTAARGGAGFLAVGAVEVRAGYAAASNNVPGRRIGPDVDGGRYTRPL